MKKLTSIVLTLVFSMALLTGCTKGTDNSGNTDTDPTPQPTPVATQHPDEMEEDSNALAYETVLAMWRDMGGYWAGADGGYLQYTLDEEGKAVLYEYDRHDAVLSYAKAVTVEATNKTAYVIEFEYPAMDTDTITQDAKTASFVLEIAGYADDYVEMTDLDGNKTVYVYVGETLDNLYDSVQTAKDLAE